MYFEIDKKHKIVDFYDDEGERITGLSYTDALEYGNVLIKAIEKVK